MKEMLNTKISMECFELYQSRWVA